MSIYTSRHKIENQQVSLNLRDIFMFLCVTFSNEILGIDSDQIEAEKSSIFVGQARYEDAAFDKTFTHSRYMRSNSCPHQSLGSEKLLLTDHQRHCDESMSKEEYFHNLSIHTRDVANLDQYNLESLVRGMYNTYLWSPVKGFTHIGNHAVDTTVVPIGEYGYQCALRMLYTTSILARLCDRFLLRAAMATETENWEFLSLETATGRQKQRAQAKLQSCCTQQEMNSEEYYSLLRIAQGVSVLDSFKEGVQSLQAAISSLMAQKLAHFSSESLLEAIFDAELPLEFSRIVPFGYTLPVTRSGRFFPKILEIDSEKALCPTIKISSEFKKMARLVKERYLAEKVYVNSQHNPGYLGNGCPLSFGKTGFTETGIGYVMKAYTHVFNLVKVDVD